MATVAICMPHAGDVPPDFYRKIGEIETLAPQHQYIHVEVDMMVIGKARNMLVETALGMNPDVLWFVDDDVILPENAPILIDQALTLGVVSGVYFARRPPYTPQVYTLASEPEHSDRIVYWPDLNIPKDGMFERDAVGAGCLAVARPVFDRLSAHFEPLFKEASELTSVLWLQSLIAGLSPWFEFLDRKGEDMYFCERCKAIDQKIWVNADVQCGHISQQLITKDYFEYMRDNNLIHKELKE